MTPDQLQERVHRIATALPEAAAVPEGQHVRFMIRNRTFGWFLHDHHGDGRVTLDLKAAVGVQQDLVGTAPDHYHVPKFLGQHGWVGVDLEQPGLDWEEVTTLIKEAYRLTAPKRLAATVA